MQPATSVLDISGVDTPLKQGAVSISFNQIHCTSAKSFALNTSHHVGLCWRLDFLNSILFAVSLEYGFHKVACPMHPCGMQAGSAHWALHRR